MKIQCPQCKNIQNAPAQFCSRCGVQFVVQPKKPPSNTTAAVIIILIAIPVICCGLLTSRPPQTGQQQPSVAQNTAAPSPTLTPQNDAERLNSAKALFNKPSVKINELDEAAGYLKSIPKAAKEYREAQKLLSAIPKKQVEIQNQQAQQTKIVNKAARQAAIDKLEQDLLKKGMDFYFTWEGKDQDVLRVKYVLMSRPVVYQITQETDFLSSMRSLGVRKVIFTDGYDDSWSFDL